MGDTLGLVELISETLNRELPSSYGKHNRQQVSKPTWEISMENVLDLM